MPSFEPSSSETPTTTSEVTPYSFPKTLFTDSLEEFQETIPCREKAFLSKASSG